MSMMQDSPDGSGHLILCIEDNAQLSEALEAVLTDVGYQVILAHSAAQARSHLQAEPSLILLDLGLPDQDGFEFLQELRIQLTVPIIVLTGNAHQVDKVKGLELGADDYITKPFDRLEMLARIQSVLRRAAIVSQPVATQSQSTLRFGDWELCQHRRTLVAPEGIAVTLTAKEFNLLCVFVTHAGEVLSRDMLMDAMAGIEWDAMDRRIDVLVSRLRRKLAKTSPSGRDLIETIRCSGYRFSPPVTDPVSAEQTPSQHAAATT